MCVNHLMLTVCLSYTIIHYQVNEVNKVKVVVKFFRQTSVSGAETIPALLVQLSVYKVGGKTPANDICVFTSDNPEEVLVRAVML